MGEFLNYLIVSYNVWFTAPLTIVFLFAIFRLLIGAMDFGDADVDADADIDADVGVDADMDIDVDADVDVDVDVDADIGADTGGLVPSFGDVFGFLKRR